MPDYEMIIIVVTSLLVGLSIICIGYYTYCKSTDLSEDQFRY